MNINVNLILGSSLFLLSILVSGYRLYLNLLRWLGKYRKQRFSGLELFLGAYVLTLFARDVLSQFKGGYDVFSQAGYWLPHVALWILFVSLVSDFVLLVAKKF